MDLKEKIDKNTTELIEILSTKDVYYIEKILGPQGLILAEEGEYLTDEQIESFKEERYEKDENTSDVNIDSIYDNIYSPIGNTKDLDASNFEVSADMESFLKLVTDIDVDNILDSIEKTMQDLNLESNLENGDAIESKVETYSHFTKEERTKVIENLPTIELDDDFKKENFDNAIQLLVKLRTSNEDKDVYKQGLSDISSIFAAKTGISLDQATDYLLVSTYDFIEDKVQELKDFATEISEKIDDFKEDIGLNKLEKLGKERFENFMENLSDKFDLDKNNDNDLDNGN